MGKIDNLEKASSIVGSPLITNDVKGGMNNVFRGS